MLDITEEPEEEISLEEEVSFVLLDYRALRQTSLYGTAATTNNDIGANVLLIKEYYD